MKGYSVMCQGATSPTVRLDGSVVILHLVLLAHCVVRSRQQGHYLGGVM